MRYGIETTVWNISIIIIEILPVVKRRWTEQNCVEFDYQKIHRHHVGTSLQILSKFVILLWFQNQNHTCEIVHEIHDYTIIMSVSA